MFGVNIQQPAPLWPSLCHLCSLCRLHQKDCWDILVNEAKIAQFKHFSYFLYQCVIPEKATFSTTQALINTKPSRDYQKLKQSDLETAYTILSTQYRYQQILPSKQNIGY